MLYSNKIDPICNKVDSAFKNCCLAFENSGNQRRATTRPVRGEHQVKLYTMGSQHQKHEVKLYTQDSQAIKA
jgi:hypothetical protein